MASFEDFSFEDLSGEDARSDGEAWSGGYEWDETPERSAAPARRPVNGRRDRRRYAPARPSAWDVWKKVLISLAAVLLVGVIVLGVGFTYASRVAKLTTIYPNVSVNGVAVGGMTVSEAARALGDDPDRYTNAAVTGWTMLWMVCSSIAVPIRSTAISTASLLQDWNAFQLDSMLPSRP